jgi:peptidoglycan/LPS O-acetylase OafA/YrhL
MKKKYIHNLTALRGIAAILVAVLHFHFFLGPVVPYGSTVIINKFYLMVDLFFILSGFIMCYVYEPKFDKGIEIKNYKKFLIARIARIYPLHLLTLCAEIFIFLFLISIGKFDVLPAHTQHLYRLDAIPIQLTFLQTVGIFNFDTFNAPAWSLSAEWWAYVLFPFLFIAFKKLGYKNWFIGFLIVLCGWLSIEFVLSGMEPFMNHPPNPNKQTLDVNWHFGTFRGIIGFIAGMVIWQLYTREKIIKYLGNGWALFVFVLLSILSMYIKFYDTLTVVLFAFVILSSAYGSKNIDKFYSFKILRKLGQWSFSIYIWHMVIIHIILLFFISNRIEPIKGLLRPFKKGYPVEILLGLFLIITCLIGWASFKFIETPTRKWINKNKS